MIGRDRDERKVYVCEAGIRMRERDRDERKV